MPPPRRSKPRSLDHDALGKAVEQLMANAGMTQEEVAERGGLNVKQINELVRGQSNPTYETLLKISQGLGVRSSRLLELAEQLRAPGSRR